MDNPYAANVLESDLTEKPRRIMGTGERHYQVRLTWEDRRLLLRTIAATRIAIVLDALLWLKSSLGYLAYFGRVFVSGDFGRFETSSDAILDLMWFATHPLALWIAWLSWRNVDLFREVVGGTAIDFSEWSQSMYRLAWFGLWSVVLYFAADISQLLQRMVWVFSYRG
jgi:hypothetical protein